MNNHAAFVMLGIVMLRFSNCDEARKAFVKTVELADGMLELCSQNYYALEGKGLALAGLILCGDEYLKPVAINIYKQMRKRSMSAGRLRRSLSLLASLPDPYNDLNEVRQVASGQ